MKGTIFYSAIVILLTGCIAAPTPEATATAVPPSIFVSADNPYGPLPGDETLTRGGLEITSINLVERIDLDPTRVEVKFLGSLPSTCNELRMEVGLPDDQYQINITTYTVIKPTPKCEQVLQQFEATVRLGVYSSGRYFVLINGTAIGDFVVY
jgi:hypothetical protein